MHTMRKSQVSLELLFVIGIAVVIFILVTILVNQEKLKLIEKEHYIKIDNECRRISELISAVYANGEGSQLYTKTEYNIYLTNNTILVFDNDIDALCSMPNLLIKSYSVNGSFKVFNTGSGVAIQ